MSITEAHLITYVADQAAAARFYAEVLGRAPVLDVPGMTQFRLADGVILGLMPEVGAARLFEGAIEPRRSRGRAELYLVVDDAAAFHARAIRAGATAVSDLKPRSWGDSVAYSLDPDGIVLGFAQRDAPTGAP